MSTRPSGMPAPAGQIVDFYYTNLGQLANSSWACELDDATVPDTSSYINGTLVTVDRDLEAGFLFEVVDYDTHLVTHYAVAVHMADLQAWAQHPHPPEPFFDRTTGEFDLIRWFVNWYEQHVTGRHHAPGRQAS